MTDYFALLNEPRRPIIDAEGLKAKFHQLSAESHPDRFHSAPDPDRQQANRKYSELNAAFNCLRQPKDRLLHLYTLENGAAPKDVQRIPPGTMDLFVEVGQLCRGTAEFLNERAKVSSPLLKVQMFQKGMEWTEKLNAVQKKVNAKRDELLDELERMNPIWAQAPPVGTPERKTHLPLERLEQVFRILSYVGRWTEQIQEQQVQLAI